MKPGIAVGIDIGSSTTRVVVCEQDGAHDKPIVLGIGAADTRGMHHGYVTNREEVLAGLRKALAEAQKESGIRIRSAALAIGGVGISCETALGAAVVSRADSIISKFDVEKAIAEAETQVETKNKAILHAFPISFKVDGKELPTRPEGLTGGKLEVKALFVSCLEQHLDDLISVVNSAGIKVTNFIAAPIAAEKMVLTDLQKNFGCALIDIGAETVSAAVYENNALSSLHVFGLGSLDITKDIALGLQITPEEAESLKLGVVSFQSIPKKKLDEIMEARLSDIFELIDKYFKKIGRSGLLPAGAIIIGGGSHLSMVQSVAKAMLKIPAKVGMLELPSRKGAIKDQRNTVAYCAAVGLLQAHGKKASRIAGGDGDGFMSVIKNFLKQLMP